MVCRDPHAATQVCNHPYLFLSDDLLSAVGPQSCGPASLRSWTDFAKAEEIGARVLLFSQMVKCLDIIDDYLDWRKYTHV